jgi:caa(3)-type oxidase subunit IV
MAQGDKKKKSNGGGEGAEKAAREASKAETAKGAAKAGSAKQGAEEQKAEDAKKGAEGAKKGAEGAKKGAGGEASKKRAEEEHAVPAKAARVEEEPEAGHGAAHGHAHGHTPDRRQYFVIFGVLFVLTVLEVVVAQLPGIGKAFLGTALVGLALAKAACVGLFYMHLKHETRILRVGVAIPLAAPALYAFVLIAEAAWRLTR